MSGALPARTAAQPIACTWDPAKAGLEHAPKPIGPLPSLKPSVGYVTPARRATRSVSSSPVESCSGSSVVIEWGNTAPQAIEKHASLNDRFVVPPFTVLDTRQGYWQERRRAWLSLGIKSEEGRPVASNGTDITKSGTTMAHITLGTSPDIVKAFESAGYNTSIFDPVLCELAYRWFAPERGHVLDPFAGGSVRGIVASYLGHPYTGIDLSPTQIDANRRQGQAILGLDMPRPAWVQGDSRDLDALLPAGEVYDLVFTCPPYFDLEVYSDSPDDLSNAADYIRFLDAYGLILARAAERLRPERFMVLVVSEIRDKEGYCRGLVPDTVRLVQGTGLRLYNEAVLVNSAGSLPVRVSAYMEAGRKLGRSHQNVLVFAKGKPQRGWSQERDAPPSPQLALFGDLT